MVNPNRFYTYAYLREDRTPYYIGKGQGNRAYKRRKKDIKPPKDKYRIIFLKQNLTEEEAFKHEIYMIAVLGRKDLGTGILHNRTDGGDGTSGFTHDEETKKILSEKLKGENNPMYGKSHSQKSKRKISEENKGKLMGEKNPCYGRKGEKHPHYGKKHTEEYKTKMSEERMGEKNPFYGKKHTEETRKKMSATRTGENNPTAKTFSVISPNREVIHSKNCSKFCEDNNLHKGAFSQVLNGKRKSHKGFRLYESEDT